MALRNWRSVANVIKGVCSKCHYHLRRIDRVQLSGLSAWMRLVLGAKPKMDEELRAVWRYRAAESCRWSVPRAFPTLAADIGQASIGFPSAAQIDPFSISHQLQVYYNPSRHLETEKLFSISRLEHSPGSFLLIHQQSPQVPPHISYLAKSNSNHRTLSNIWH